MYNISGSVKWDLQELLAQSSGEQQNSEEISCLFPMSEDGQGGHSTKKLNQR
jgi:hypothetical protein